MPATFTYFSASCDPLTALSNGKVKSNNLKHGALASFSCNKGFHLKGPKQIACVDGKWNESSPTCKGLRLSNDRIYLIFKATPADALEMSIKFPGCTTATTTNEHITWK